MQVVIDIPEDYYKAIKEIPVEQSTADMLIIRNGTPLPKHGRLIDADALNLYNISPSLDEELSVFGVTAEDVDLAPTIIEADKEYEAEVITRGNCMICGKELDEGLFFCKECEAKAEREDKE